ncbi:hypothetical protein PRIPAC_98044 [Pristionchus pacificus]|nr:hypothetical protein PRIPAC_98044 [Pristionchus pacificus]
MLYIIAMSFAVYNWYYIGNELLPLAHSLLAPIIPASNLVVFDITSAFVALILFAALINGLSPLGNAKMVVMLAHVCILTLEARTALDSAKRFLTVPAFFNRYRHQLLYQFGVSAFHATVHMAVTQYIVWKSFSWRNITKPTLFWSGIVFNAYAMKLFQVAVYGGRVNFAFFELLPAFIMAMNFTGLFRKWAHARTLSDQGDIRTPSLPVRFFVLERLIPLCFFNAVQVRRPIIGIMWKYQLNLTVFFTAVETIYVMHSQATARLGAFFFFLGTGIASIGPVLFSHLLDFIDFHLRLDRGTSSPACTLIDLVMLMQRKCLA